MLRLHTSPDTAATILRLVAAQAAIPLDLAPIDRLGGGLTGPDYLALNPTATIPTLETPHGPVSETGAALLWLADAHGLCPAPGDADRPAFLKWLFFLSNTLHSDLRQMIRPWRYAAPGAEAAQTTMAAARVLTALSQIEDALLARPALFPPLGPLTAYLLMLTRWAAQYPADHAAWFRLDAFPAIAALAKRAESLPATRSIADDEGLGSHPFTAPLPAEIPTP